MLSHRALNGTPRNVDRFILSYTDSALYIPVPSPISLAHSFPLSLSRSFFRSLSSFRSISLSLSFSRPHLHNFLSVAREIWLDSYLYKFLKRKDNALSFKHESVVISSFGESNSAAAYVNCQFCCYMYILVLCAVRFGVDVLLHAHCRCCCRRLSIWSKNRNGQFKYYSLAVLY